MNHSGINPEPPGTSEAISKYKMVSFDNTNPFCTCHSSGNLVDGLPLAIHEDAFLAYCRFSGRASFRKFRCKIIDDTTFIEY